MSQNIDIAKEISVISNKIRHLLDASCAGIGITGTQASILHFIYKNGKNNDVFQRDIETEFNIRRSSVTSVLHGLEQNGFIRRESVKEDARLNKLVLTDKAIEISEHIKGIRNGINDTLLKQLENEDIAYLDSLLTKMGENLP